MNFVGYTPKPWQRDLHDAMKDSIHSGKVFVVKSRRQIGKSVCCENVLLYFALNYAKTISAMVSPTLSQSRKIFKDIVNAVGNSGAIKKKNETLLEITFINGSEVFFKSAEQRDALRGYSVSGILVMDECAYLSDDMLELVMPWTNVYKTPILMVSTPKVKNGFFFRYYEIGVSKMNDNIISFDWNKYDTSVFLSNEMLEQYRKMLPKQQFRSEYMGEFLDGDGMVFTDLNANIGNPQSNNALYVGIDWAVGGGNDYTSLTIFNNNAEMVDIQYWNDKQTFEQIETITDILMENKNKIMAIQAEDNSIGSPFIDLLEKNLKDKGCYSLANKIIRFTTTNESKANIVSQFCVGLEQHTLKLLDDNTLISQLSTYEATYNYKTGKVSYNGALGTHDDLVMSTLLAYDAYKKSNKNGVYCLGFNRK